MHASIDTFAPVLLNTQQAAYFLDLDGTLAPIVSDPDLASVDAQTRAAVEGLHQKTKGAIAIISGRPLIDIDQLMHKACTAVSAEHGAVTRFSDGSIYLAPSTYALVARITEIINRLIMAQGLRGLFIEIKKTGVALHYRTQPHLYIDAVHIMRHALRSQTLFTLSEGHLVIEAKLTPNNKGTAVRSLMQSPPFIGRIPVMIGDDNTDESAFSVVNAMGGISIKVGSGQSQANYRLADTTSVKTWLLDQLFNKN
jgi:trehalose 6-phosphate phosphatase